MGRESVGFSMSDILGPVVAGASLGYALVFLMAVANGMSALIFNGKTITASIGGRLGGAE
jgi:ABC-type Co2+ transport system permease subunit